MLNLYNSIVTVYFILNFILMFGLVPKYKNYIYTLYCYTGRAIEPVVSKIRRFVPSLNGIDMSWTVFFIGTYLLEQIVVFVLSYTPR